MLPKWSSPSAMTPTNTTEFDDDLLETSIDHRKPRNQCRRYKRKVLSGEKGVKDIYKDRKISAFQTQPAAFDSKSDGTRAIAVPFSNLSANSAAGQKKTVGSTKWMPLLPKDPSHGNSGALKMEADRKQSFEICIVCGDKASGRHYGAISCEGCKGFFKRSIRKMLAYSCRGSKDCEVTKHHRNRCQYCRLQKCLNMGMRSDSVQSERKPLDNREKYKSPSGHSGGSGYLTFGSSCSSTNQKLFSRKDITAASSYIGEKSRTAAFLNAQLLENMANMPTTDLSTLASVVTTFAAMNKHNEGRNGRDSASSPSPDDGDTVSDDESDSATSDIKEKKIFSRAFDTLAKVVQSQNVHLQDSNFEAEGLGYNSDQDDSDTLFDEDGFLILDINHVPFNLNAPSPMPTHLNAHFICESASRLLFLSVHWARSIPTFQRLSTEVQTSLIRGAWSELFALGLAQCSHVMNLSTILSAIISQLQNNVLEGKLTPARGRQVTEHICKLQDYLVNMSRLQVDEHEYAYLKAIALFSPDHLSLNNAVQMEKLQDKVNRELRTYIEQAIPNNSDRFHKLLLRLPSLRSLEPNIMEQLFFAGLIGNVQIDNIIPYILRMETNGYTPNLDDISPSDSMEVNTGLRT